MISGDEVRKLARLARLRLGEEEVLSLTKDLGSILDYVKQLESLDASNIEPMSHVHGSTNIFREDGVKPSMPIEELTQNAPDTSGRFFRTPIIIE